jgi:hypothetical protein
MVVQSWQVGAALGVFAVQTLLSPAINATAVRTQSAVQRMSSQVEIRQFRMLLGPSGAWRKSTVCVAWRSGPPS